MKPFVWFLSLVALFTLAACSAAQMQPASVHAQVPETGPSVTATPPPTAAAVNAVPAAAVAQTAAPTAAAPTPQVSPTPRPTLAKNEWKKAPVIPTVSERARQIYQHGLSLGNDPQHFSKVGDCQTVMPFFLGDFDRGTKIYHLGTYSSLQPAVDYFTGSWGRRSLAAKNGLTASAVMVGLWNDWKECSKNETPLDCEYRIHRPSIAIISFGTNDISGYAPFEAKLRRVIEHTIELGIVPILSTKADNLEGNHAVNDTIVRLAYEYDIPLWNFWLAVQPLPDHGMRSPAHLTMGTGFYADFEDPQNMKAAMPIRNLTALQALDAVWRGVTTNP